VRQTKRWRAAFLEAVLRQDIGWFDVSSPSELTSRIGEASSRVEVGLGKKTSEIIQFTSMAIGEFHSEISLTLPLTLTPNPAYPNPHPGSNAFVCDLACFIPKCPQP